MLFRNYKTIFLNQSVKAILFGLLSVTGIFFLAFCSKPVTNSSDRADSGSIPVYTYKVIRSYPHDRRAFTQGLAFENGFLYEGTGMRGQSTLRKIELKSGRNLQIHRLSAQFFGEGVTLFGSKIVQLTWLSRVGFVYDKHSFVLLQKFSYPTEGWGITHDGKHFIMSDGTATLYFLEPGTFKEIKRLEVYNQDGPVTRLNELEFIQGEIYANIWQTDYIIRVDPKTGQVVGWIDLTGILRPDDRRYPVDVLNGIAYDEKNGRLFVTGKLWPKIFEIELYKRNDDKKKNSFYDNGVSVSLWKH